MISSCDAAPPSRVDHIARRPAGALLDSRPSLPLRSDPNARGSRTRATVRSLLITLGYSYENHSIWRSQQFLSAHNVQVDQPTNFDYSEALTLSLTLPLTLTNWLDVRINGFAISSDTRGRLGDEIVRLTRNSGRASILNSVKLPGALKLEVMTFVRSAGSFGATQMGGSWWTNATLQKSIMGDQGTLSLSAYNLFDSSDLTYRTGEPDGRYYVEQRYDDYRSIQLTFSVRFGKQRTSRERSTASQEEQGRI